jgi:hypothetical protein
VSNLSLLVPIIVALIGIIGTIAPSFIDRSVSQNEKNPVIEFEYDIDLKNSIILTISNKGNGPATNMSLFINTTPISISNVTNLMTTSDISSNNMSLDIGKSIRVNNTNIKIQTPTFVQGSGSIISLKLYFDTNILETNLNLTSMSIYDQGSSYSRFSSINKPPNFDFQSNEYMVYYTFINLPIFIYFLYYLHISRKKRYYKRIITSLLSIRHTLKLDIYTEIIFENLWNIKGVTYVDKILDKNRSELLTLENFRKSMDTKDYILLDDFFTLLNKRNFLLQSDTMTNQLKTKDDKVKELNHKYIDWAVCYFYIFESL